jgi:ABC-2 type transport system ATP-binding protein
VEDPLAIVARGLTRHFPSGTALDGLTFEVRPGEVLALLGPNGAGKTTTVRLLNGVLAPDAGTATVVGFDPITQGDEVRRRTGVLTETAGLDERLTARENLVFSGRIRSMSKTQAGSRADALLHELGMADRADTNVQGFSTGERKRVALARALLHHPEVLFLDEPTSGLDPAATRDVVDLIARLATEEGRTVVLCTHFLPEAGRLADRMAVLDHGHLLAFGRPEELAADLWDGLAAEIDLGTRADERVLAVARSTSGVLDAEPVADGLHVRVHTREVLPVLVAHLVEAGLPVYASVPRPATLEDVYFEVTARAGVSPAPEDLAA